MGIILRKMDAFCPEILDHGDASKSLLEFLSFHNDFVPKTD